jgi:hypothetical protein
MFRVPSISQHGERVALERLEEAGAGSFHGRFLEKDFGKSSKKDLQRGGRFAPSPFPSFHCLEKS